MEGTVVRRHRAPGEAECRYEEPSTLIEHALFDHRRQHRLNPRLHLLLRPIFPHLRQFHALFLEHLGQRTLEFPSYMFWGTEAHIGSLTAIREVRVQIVLRRDDAGDGIDDRELTSLQFDFAVDWLLLKGLAITLELSLGSLVLGSLGGIVLGAMRSSEWCSADQPGVAIADRPGGARPARPA
jgi:hypothetical protein